MKNMVKRSVLLLLGLVLVACSSTPTPVPTSTPMPTNTPKPLATPTVAPTLTPLGQIIYAESTQRQIYLEWVEAQNSKIGDEDVCEEIARRWGITVDAVIDIAMEGFEKNWPRLAATATSIPPTPIPTPTPMPAAVPPTQPPSSERTLARVMEAVSGDTIQVNISGTTYTICYAGVDAPELTEWMGWEAVQANRRFVKGTTVYLEKDVSDTDQSGCLLRHVFQEDGTLVSAKLVHFGYAEVRTDSPDARYRDSLLQMQQGAKKARRGLWGSMPTPTAVAPTPVKATPTLKPVKATSTPRPTETPAHDIKLSVGVDNLVPPPLTWVCVRGRIFVDGKPARGVTMKTTWHYKEWDDHCTAITNGTPDNPGIASCCLSSGPFQGYTVKVDVVFTYEGKNYGTPVEFLVK